MQMYKIKIVMISFSFLYILHYGKMSCCFFDIRGCGLNVSHDTEIKILFTNWSHRTQEVLFCAALQSRWEM